MSRPPRSRPPLWIASKTSSPTSYLPDVLYVNAASRPPSEPTSPPTVDFDSLFTWLASKTSSSTSYFHVVLHVIAVGREEEGRRKGLERVASPLSARVYGTARSMANSAPSDREHSAHSALERRLERRGRGGSRRQAQENEVGASREGTCKQPREDVQALEVGASRGAQALEVGASARGRSQPRRASARDPEPQSHEDAPRIA